MKEPENIKPFLQHQLEKRIWLVAVQHNTKETMCMRKWDEAKIKQKYQETNLTTRLGQNYERKTKRQAKRKRQRKTIKGGLIIREKF